MTTVPTLLVDHIVIAGRDLATLVAAFTTLGLAPDPGGIHADGQTHNALIGFADGSYLELITPVPGGRAPGHPWSGFMNTVPGVCAWAVRSEDIERDTALYRERGVTVTEPKPGGRERPDGVRLEWITAALGDGPLGSLLPFLIQDVTPREWRVPHTASAEGLITGVAEILIGVSDGSRDLPTRFAGAFGGALRMAAGPEPGAPPHMWLDGTTPITFQNPAIRTGLFGCLLRAANIDTVAERFPAYPMTWRGHDGLWAKLASPAIVGII